MVHGISNVKTSYFFENGGYTAVGIVGITAAIIIGKELI